MPAWKPTLKPSDGGIDKNLLAIVQAYSQIQINTFAQGTSNLRHLDSVEPAQRLLKTTLQQIKQDNDIINMPSLFEIPIQVGLLVKM